MGLFKQWWGQLGMGDTTHSHQVTHSANGSIVLGFGQHEISVYLEHTPCQVKITIQDPCDGILVCHGALNKIGTTIADNGFILQADIQTNTCCIEWECDV